MYLPGAVTAVKPLASHHHDMTSLRTPHSAYGVRILGRARLSDGRVALLLVCERCRELIRSFTSEGLEHDCGAGRQEPQPPVFTSSE
jgi:hypothetical protein